MRPKLWKEVTMKKQWIALLLLMALLLGACSQPAKEEPAPTEEAPSGEEAVTPGLADDAPWNEQLIAKVGEKELPRKTYNALMALATYNYIDRYGRDVVEQDTFPMADLMINTREDFIMGSIVSQLAQERGMEVDLEIVSQINANFSAQIESNADFAAFLEEEGVSHEDLMPYIEMQSFFDALLADLRAEVEESQEYKEKVEDALLYHARHILLDAAAEDAEAKAREILEDLQANPETFAEQAELLSADTASAVAGGDLGYFAPEMMVPEFSSAVTGAEIGEIVMTRSQFGYHIIEVLETKTVAQLEAEGLGPVIAQSKAQLMNPLLSDLYNREVGRMQEKLAIEYYALEKNE